METFTSFALPISSSKPVSLELNLWLELQMVMYSFTGQGEAPTLHKSSLRFFFGRLLLPQASGSTSGYETVEGISNLLFNLSESDRYLLSFGYGYAVPHNLYIADEIGNQLTDSGETLA